MKGNMFSNQIVIKIIWGIALWGVAVCSAGIFGKLL